MECRNTHQCAFRGRRSTTRWRKPRTSITPITDKAAMTEIHSHADEHSKDVVAEPGPEQEALAALNSYMDAWNCRDIDGMNAAFHFPHVRIASGTIRVTDESTTFPPDFFEQFVESTGWHYSLWDYRRAVQSEQDKVHFAVQFTRYRQDGTMIGHYPSMWIVAKIDGRWGVQGRSSFAP